MPTLIEAQPTEDSERDHLLGAQVVAKATRRCAIGRRLTPATMP